MKQTGHETTDTVGFPSYAVPGVTKCRETDGRMVVSRAWARGWGREWVGASWAQFLFYEIKNVLGGGSCTTV